MKGQGRLLAALAVSGALHAAPLAAAPFVPADDAVVLEANLPTRDPRMGRIRDLAAALAEQPASLDLAMDLAAAQLALGLGQADPRFVGYAEGTLARWRHEPGPAGLLVLRARILQARHAYGPALDLLARVLKVEPDNADAAAVLAAIAETTGDLDRAAQGCAVIARAAPGLAAVACQASVDSLRGQAGVAHDRLSAALETAGGTDATTVWAYGILAEIKARLDRPDAGEAFRTALTLEPTDIYVLTAYADWLLDQGRPAEVLALLAPFGQVDALLLRLALAAQAADDPQLPDAVRQLEARFALARQQGDKAHLRDAARHALAFGDAAQALEFAQADWAVQKTPADARVLVAAALAAGRPEAAQPVVDFLAATGLQDAPLRRLLARLPAG